MVSERDIRLALSDHILTLNSPAIPTEIEDVDFDIPASGPWLQTQLLRGRPQRLSISGNHRHVGIFQVSSMTLAGNDSAEADRIVDRVKALFPVDFHLGVGAERLRIYEEPEAHNGYRDGAWWRVPISIRYEILS